jgi:hypothetical protein
MEERVCKWYGKTYNREAFDAYFEYCSEKCKHEAKKAKE